MVESSLAESTYPYSWPKLVSAYFRRYPNPYATHVISVDVIDRQLVPASASRRQWPTDGRDDSEAGSAPRLGAAELHRNRPVVRPGSAQDPSIEDELAAEPMVLRTTRLILKRGTLPKWAPSGIIKNAESWVLEETEVELDLNDSAGQAASGGQAPDASGRKDLYGREMRVWTRNLDHTNVLAVTEGLRLRESLEAAPTAAAEAEGAASRQAQKPPSRSFGSYFGGASDLRSRQNAALFRSEAPVHSDSAARAAVLAYRSLPLTHCLTTGHMQSSVGFGLLQRRIEKFGLKRFKAHSDTSRAGLCWVVDTSDQLRRGDDAALRALRAGMAAAQHGGPKERGPAESAAAAAALDGAARAAEEGDAADRTRPRLRAAFRPPWLDGYPATPLQRLRNWWKGEPGRVQQAKEAEERIRWAYKARELFKVNLPQLNAPEERADTPDRSQSSPWWAWRWRRKGASEPSEAAAPDA